MVVANWTGGMVGNAVPEPPDKATPVGDPVTVPVAVPVGDPVTVPVAVPEPAPEKVPDIAGSVALSMVGRVVGATVPLPLASELPIAVVKSPISLLRPESHVMPCVCEPWPDGMLTEPLSVVLTDSVGDELNVVATDKLADVLKVVATAKLRLGRFARLSVIAWWPQEPPGAVSLPQSERLPAFPFDPCES